MASILKTLLVFLIEGKEEELCFDVRKVRKNEFVLVIVAATNFLFNSLLKISDSSLLLLLSYQPDCSAGSTANSKTCSHPFTGLERYKIWIPTPTTTTTSTTVAALIKLLAYSIGTPATVKS